jgi:hypothetical protein
MLPKTREGTPLRIDQRPKILGRLIKGGTASLKSHYDICVFGGPDTFLSGIPPSDILFRISAERGDMVTR